MRPIVAATVAAFALTAHPLSAIGAAPPVDGPFGTGADSVWLLRPQTRPRSVVVFLHGWKVAPPSPSYPWVGQFRPWLDHLAARGSAVVFPRYQLGGDAPGPARAASLRSGLARGFARLGLRGLPVVVVGYSYGASLGLTYAADARRWGLPDPSAAVAIFPVGPIPGVPLDRIPARVRVLIQVGDRDAVAGRSGADAYWALLADHPAARKRYEIVRSGPSLIADHSAPKSSTPTARRTFWAPLDALVARARAR